MSTGPENGAPPGDGAAETSPKKDFTAEKKDTMTAASRQMLRAEAQSPRRKLAEGEKPENLTPAERALNVYANIRTGETAKGEPYEGAFFAGSALKLGAQEHKIRTDKGIKLFTSANGEIAIAAIDKIITDEDVANGDAESEDEGKYRCFVSDTQSDRIIFLDRDNNPIKVEVKPQPKANGEMESSWEALDRVAEAQLKEGNKILELAIDKDEAADTQLVDETDTIKAALPPKKAVLFDEYVKALSQNDPQGIYLPPGDIDAIIDDANVSQDDEPVKPPQAEKETTEPVGKVIAIEIGKIKEALFYTDAAGNILYKMDGNERIQAEKQLAGLQAALVAKGKFGEITRMAKLMEAKNMAGGATTGVDRILRDDSFLEDYKESMESFEKFATEKGLDPSQKQNLLNAIRNPEQLTDLLENTNETVSGAAAEAVEGVFGRAISDTDLDNIFDSLLNADKDLVDESWKGKIKRALTENKARKLGLLAILMASIPVVVAGIAAYGALELTGSIAGAAAKG